MLSLEERASRTVNDVMEPPVLTLLPDETLDNALESLTSHHRHWAPVVEAEPLSQQKRVTGLLSVSDIVKLYRSTLTREARRMQGIVEGTIMKELIVEPDMLLANRPLKEAKIPADCLIVSIRHQNKLLFPRGGTIMQPGDTITVMMNPQGEIAWNTYLLGRDDSPEDNLVTSNEELTSANRDSASLTRLS